MKSRVGSGETEVKQVTSTTRADDWELFLLLGGDVHDETFKRLVAQAHLERN